MQPRAARILISVRVALAAFALAAVVASFVLTSGGETESHGSGTVTYVCPMHPDVTAAAPAECAICRMELVLKGAPQAHAPEPRAAPSSKAASPRAPGAQTAEYACPMHPEITSATPDRCRLCRMSLAPIEPPAASPPPAASANPAADSHAGDSATTHACPMHPQVTSSRPDRCRICKMPLEPTSSGSAPIRAAGATVAYACPMHRHETSPHEVKCRICKMPMQRVAPAHADAHLHDGADPSAVSLPKAGLFSFHDVTRARPRTSSREMRAPAWLETPRRGAALLYVDECKLLERGEQGLFLPTSGPGEGAIADAGVRLLDEPPAPWDAATALVRFELDERADLPANRTGWLKLASRARNDLSIPYSAVIQAPDGPYVLVLSENLRSVSKRPITIGSVLFGYASVVAGLRDGDRIAAMRTFSLDVLRKQLETPR